MSDLLAPPRPRSDRRALVAGQSVAAALAALVAVLLTSGLTADPATVDRVTVVNPYPYQLAIDVAGAGERSTMAVGTVERERRAVFERVVDQGDVWVFRFSYAGAVAGEVTVERDELRRANWTIETPAGTEARLRGAGLAPSA